MKRFYSIIQSITHTVSRDFSAFLVFFLMSLVMVETFSRYVLSAPLMLVDEFGGYMMVAIVIIGIADTWEAKGHISIDTFTKRMPTRLRNWVRFVTFAMATLLGPILIITSIQLVTYSHKYGVRNESWLRTPLKWPQLVLIIGFVLLFVQQIISLIRSAEILRAREGDKDKWNHNK